MMVIGLGYCLLFMVIPAASPAGRTIHVSAIVLETGIVGLFVTLLLRSELTPLFAVVIVAGFAAAGSARRMDVQSAANAAAGRQSKRVCDGSHRDRRRAWLLCACVCGVGLTFAPMTEMTLRARASLRRVRSRGVSRADHRRLRASTFCRRLPHAGRSSAAAAR